MRFLCNAPAHAQQMVIDSFAPNRQDSDYSALVAKLIFRGIWKTDGPQTSGGIRVYGNGVPYLCIYILTDSWCYDS